jgi:hypothetical protein
MPAASHPLLDPALVAYFVAGGAAGAASRTVVSPLERLKIIQCARFLCVRAGGRLSARRQVQRRAAGVKPEGVFRSLVRMWKEEVRLRAGRGCGYGLMVCSAVRTGLVSRERDQLREVSCPSLIRCGVMLICVQDRTV